MSVLLAIGLVCQALAILLVFVFLGRRAVGLIGVAFIGVAVIFHGLTEISQLWTPFNLYDPFANQEAVDRWVWIAGVAILGMTVSYLLALREVPLQQDASDLPIFDWRVLLVLSVPIYYVALQFDPNQSNDGGTLYWLAGLSAQFLIIALALASLDYIRKNGSRYVLAVLLIQALVLAPIGSRWSVAAGLLLTLYALNRLGISLPRRQLAVAALSVVALTIVISSSRSATGGQVRHDQTSLIQGVQELPRAIREGSIVSDWDYRFDGNTFPAAVGHAMREGRSTAPAARLVDTAILAIPSFVYSEKTSRSLAERNEETYMIIQYGLRTTDYLPTTLGIVYGYGGAVGVLVFAILLGIVLALLDRWVLARLTIVRLLVALGALLCVLLYEQAFEGWVLVLRGIVVLLIAAKAVEFCRSALHRRRLLMAGEG